MLKKQQQQCQNEQQQQEQVNANDAVVTEKTMKNHVDKASDTSAKKNGQGSEDLKKNELLLGTEGELVQSSVPASTTTEVKLRNQKKGKMQLNDDAETKDNVENSKQQNGSERTDNELIFDTAALLQRTMEALHEVNPDLEDSHEEIRKLDSQLDHLNEYMDRVEERIRAHNEKLMETLKQQKENREKRRRSFHERLEHDRQEEENFQKQLNTVLTRVDSLRRQNSCDDVKEEFSDRADSEN